MNRTKFPQALKQLVPLMGYILLIGPPKAIEIQARAKRNEDELMGHSLLFVLFSESSLRAGVFLILGFSLEYLVGNELFERYRLDYLLLVLIVAGGIHILAYYLGKGLIIHSNYLYGLLVYRLGRNIAYAFLPAIVVAILTVYSQYLGQIELFSRSLVQMAFSMTFLIFLLIGVQEAIVFRQGLNFKHQPNKKPKPGPKQFSSQ